MHVPAADSTPLEAARGRLLRHPLRQVLTTADAWRIFMAHHVFAVWDFMSLVKRLQRDLTCIQKPWLPPIDAQASRFINAVVLAEESDDDGDGGFTSHFDLYLGAMAQSGVDTAPAKSFVSLLRAGVSVAIALRRSGAPTAVIPFVTGTLRLAEHGRTEEVCAAFFWGREEIIPDMFGGMLESLASCGHFAPRLRTYMDRHITLDGDEHGPMARAVLARLCAADPAAVSRAEAAALSALSAREHLWQGIHTAIVATEIKSTESIVASSAGGHRRADHLAK